jgi:hypothetical protein
MRSEECFAVHAATAFAALAAALFVALAPSIVLAEQAQTLQPVARPAPDVRAPQAYPDFRASLDDVDEMATLDAIHVALSQVGDGGSYVWHRNHGRLSGVFQPTQSFKDSAGTVCRHLVVTLSSGAAVRRTEGIACRLSTGRWQLAG